MTFFPTALSAGWRFCWCGWPMHPEATDCTACEIFFKLTLRTSPPEAE